MRPEASDPSVLQCARLAKHFRSGSRTIEVLQDVSLELPASRVLSIQGVSGSGKSTLLNLLAGIESPDSGQVFWKGQALDSVPESRRPAIRASYLGFVFQSFYLVPELDTLGNILLAARIAGLDLGEARRRARQLLEELDLAGRSGSRPDQLSGGERQRTAIARALINRPSVVLADEPTGNLDEHTAERVIQQLLEAVRRHSTALVLVTHNPRFAAMGDLRYRLEDGRLNPHG